MVDIESKVFTVVSAALRSQFPGIFVAGETVATPPAFPAVMLVEMDNSTYTRSLDTSGKENHAALMYQAEAYSNLSVGKKNQCRSIIKAIDEKMQAMGFVRVGSSPMQLPNSDSTIYRMVSRYRATVSKDEVIYRR